MVPEGDLPTISPSYPDNAPSNDRLVVVRDDKSDATVVSVNAQESSTGSVLVSEPFTQVVFLLYNT
jgi:hypothetical protein